MNQEDIKFNQIIKHEFNDRMEMNLFNINNSKSNCMLFRPNHLQKIHFLYEIDSPSKFLANSDVKQTYVCLDYQNYALFLGIEFMYYKYKCYALKADNIKKMYEYLKMDMP